ncbi:MAG: dual specificity protein phosphatase family protein [Thermoguttaceae bacterium]|jgi:protein-tyrosine phosphatase
MNLDPILPNLYVGSCPVNPADIDRLQQEFKISAVLNVQTDDDFAYWGIDWDRLEAHYRRQGIAVRRVPIHDFESDDLRRNLFAGVQALDELVRHGHTVYVHCSAGINRSTSTVVAYLHWIEGRSLEDAVAHVTGCRNCDPYVDAIRLAIEDQRKRATAEASEPPPA